MPRRGPDADGALVDPERQIWVRRRPLVVAGSGEVHGRLCRRGGGPGVARPYPTACLKKTRQSCSGTCEEEDAMYNQPPAISYLARCSPSSLGNHDPVVPVVPVRKPGAEVHEGVDDVDDGKACRAVGR